MKTLITLIFSVVLLTTIHSQDVSDIRGAYFSAYAGAGPRFDDGIYFGLGASGGYQWNHLVGVGGSFCGHIGLELFTTGFKGVSLQYRMKPNERWAATIDYGYILSHIQTTDATVFEYIPGWYPFFKFHFSRKMGDIFTLGLNFTGLPKVKYKECPYSDPLDPCTPYISTEEFTASGILITCGMTIDWTQK